MPSLSILHSSFPMLARADTGHVVDWGKDEMYSVLLTSTSIRINRLGVSWCPLCGHSALGSTGMLRHVWMLQGWSTSMECLPVTNALCTASVGPDRITFFPTDLVHVPLLQSVFFAGVHPCNSKTANRQITSSVTEYDVSLCDVLDRNLEFVVDLHANRLYWKQELKPMWWSLLLTISSLYFFTRACQHFTMLVQGKRRSFSVSTTIAIVCMLVLGRCLLAFSVLSQHLVTREELILNIVLECYCYVYVVAELLNVVMRRAHADTARENDISTLGSLLAVQLVLTAQLANTYENPFVGVLTLMFGSRVFLKFLNFMLVHTIGTKSSEKTKTVLSKFVFLSIDIFTLCCVFELGVRSAARSEEEYASTVTVLLIIIVLGGSFLHTVIQCHKNLYQKVWP